MSNDRDEAPYKRSTPFLISFSGIDGAGKTTQIEFLTSYLQSLGLRVLRLTFWDDVAVLSRLRSDVGQKAAELRRPEKSGDITFEPKNHKHIRNWYLAGARVGFYILDVVHLKRLLSSPAVRQSDVIICDRYIYDQIANLYSKSYIADLYRQALLNYAPKPDLAFVIDANPDKAFARKPEYPLEFVHQNRNNFLRLRELIPEMIVIGDASPELVRDEIQMHVQSELGKRLASSVLNPEGSRVSAVAASRTSCRVQTEPTESV